MSSGSALDMPGFDFLLKWPGEQWGFEPEQNGEK